MPLRSSDAEPPAATIEADGIRAVFFRAGDRYAHHIEVWDAEQGSWRPVWESVEGAADDGWPPSPPLQQLHVEQRPEGPVALLVGMAGRTHWSAAVEVVRGKAAASDAESAPREIRFDVAARVTAVERAQEPAAAAMAAMAPLLGSNYRRSSSEMPTPALIGALDGSEAVGGAALVAAAAGAGVAIRPSGFPASESRSAQTVSWRYVVRRA